MLEATILDLRSVGACELRKYEALRNTNAANAITQFLFAEPKFRDRRVQEFWELYDAIDPNMKEVAPDAERRERDAFTRKPFYVAVSRKTVGGLWVEEENNTAHLHVLVASEMRGKGVGKALLSWFEEHARGTYEEVSCAWMLSRESSAASLFARAGYEIRIEAGAGIARKVLSQAVLK